MLCFKMGLMYPKLTQWPKNLPRIWILQFSCPRSTINHYFEGFEEDSSGKSNLKEHRGPRTFEGGSWAHGCQVFVRSRVCISLPSVAGEQQQRLLPLDFILFLKSVVLMDHPVRYQPPNVYLEEGGCLFIYTVVFLKCIWQQEVAKLDQSTNVTEVTVIFVSCFGAPLERKAGEDIC